MGCFQAKVGKFVSSPFVVQQVRRFCDFSAFAAESGGALDFFKFDFQLFYFRIRDPRFIRAPPSAGLFGEGASRDALSSKGRNEREPNQ